MLKLFLFAIALYSLTGLFLYIKQRDMMYYPMPEKKHVNATDLWLDTDQARLKIWRFNEGDPAILYFGGNAEAVEQNIPDFRHLFEGFTVYLVNYRGYAGSSGKPSERALFEDALAVYDELKSRHSSIHVIGRSLGSGVACYLAEQRPLGKMILITPYDSMANLAKSHYPLFPVQWLIKDPFDSIGRAGAINIPVLVLMAQQDEVVPLKLSQRLVRALKSATVEAHVIVATHHNDITNSPVTLNHLQRFLTDSL